MKVGLTIICYLFLNIFSFGQEGVLRTKLMEENYDLGRVSAEEHDSFYFGLQPIQNTTFKSHFRISLTGQFIDLYSNDHSSYQGILTNYTTEYLCVKDKNNDYQECKEIQYVFEQIYLDPLKVKYVVERLMKTGQAEIPTDTSIDSWQRNFLHCDGIVFQCNIDGRYIKQVFHCPWGQNDSVAFKNIILDNYQTLKSTFQLDSFYTNFEKKLPKGKTYSVNGYVMMYTMADQQVENWEKSQPQRDFMKSVKDTIDRYLNAELKKQRIALNGINCFEDYRLTFGKNGKLKKIILSDYNKPKLKNSIGLRDFLANKAEIRRCKRKIKQIFSGIDLGFLKLETEIYRTLSFGMNNEVLLRDDTIY